MEAAEAMEAILSLKFEIEIVSRIQKLLVWRSVSTDRNEIK